MNLDDSQLKRIHDTWLAVSRACDIESGNVPRDLLEALAAHADALAPITPPTSSPMPLERSVQPDWARRLPIQQQSVLFLAGRGPDGVAKRHPCKPVVIAYRGTVFVAAKYGRQLRWGERADTFMSLDRFADDELWLRDVAVFFENHDSLPKHYLAHLMHGAEIVGYKHPDGRFRQRWLAFYMAMVEDLHLTIETEAQMDQRLGDWERRAW